MFGSISEYVNAEPIVFESVENFDYFYLDISDSPVAYLRIDDKMLHFKPDILLDVNGDFNIKYSNNNIRVFVYPHDNSYKGLVIITDEIKTTYNFEFKKLDISPYEKPLKENLNPLEKLQKYSVLTGPESAERLAEIQRELEIQQELLAAQNVTITPRSEYTISKNNQLEIIVRSDFTVPIKTTFDFDLQAVNPQKNLYHDFYGPDKIGDVIITGNITDADGKVWVNINSTTSQNGYFKNLGLYIPDNTSTRGEWSLFLHAVKYFDDENTFSIFNIVKPFFIAENPNNKATVLPPTMIEISAEINPINCDVENSCFDPDDIIIDQNESVTWQNKDDISHNIKSGDSIFDGLEGNGDFKFDLKPGTQKTINSFKDVGDYSYFCSTHPAMVGHITVK